MFALFLAAVFLSAWLLFTVQPMAAKWLLPELGGSPAVWIVASLFFQLALLAGYLYSHLLSRLGRIGVQVSIHAALLVAAIGWIPLALGAAGAHPAAPPALWLVSSLAASLGIPVLALSSTGPLLQHWYAAAGRRDPYFLYAASNLGSLGGLLAYPFVLERWLPLHGSAGEASQNTVWSGTYVAFAALCLTCGGAALFRRVPGAEPVPRQRGEGDRVSWRTRAFWMALAAVPSSAMLGTTLAITTDIAAVPLLWVFPLAIYLATFVVAFGKPGTLAPRNSAGLLALGVAGIALVRWRDIRPDPLPLIALSLFTLAALAYACHDRLSRARPAPAFLTEFYLWVAVGGALGGVCNALLAPLLFRTILEYPVALVAAVLLCPPRLRQADPTGVGRLLPALVLALLFLGATLANAPTGETLFAERTFFGVLRVDQRKNLPVRMQAEDGTVSLVSVDVHELFHGTTRHGRQVIGLGMERWGASYYHPTGPAGMLFRTFRGSGRFRNAALVGLGVGALACYGERGQTLTFYEIDPAIVRIAEDPELFTYLRDSRAEVRIRVGDGRVLLAAEPDQSFDLVVVDAFTSDAIPVHLMTEEAFATYFRKLRPDGVLAVHLTNEHFDLLPVVRSLAATLGLTGLEWEDRRIGPREEVGGKSPSTWAVLARSPETLEPLRANGEWNPLDAGPREPAWTDARSSPLRAMRP